MAKKWPLYVGLNPDGTVDEIVLSDARGHVLFHLEQMDDTHFWFALYGPNDAGGYDEELRGYIGSATGRAKVRCGLPDGLPDALQPPAPEPAASPDAPGAGR